MNDDQILNDLDERARAAAEDVRAVAAGRPVPAFDPDLAPTVPLATAGSARSRLPRPFLAAAAAAVVILLGVGLWIGTRDDSDGTDVAEQVVSGSIQPYLPTVVPEGMELTGAAESDGSADPNMSTSGYVGPLSTFGPAVDDPRLAAFATSEPSYDSDADSASSASATVECVERLEDGATIEECRSVSSDSDDPGSTSGEQETSTDVGDLAPDRNRQEIAVGDRTGYLQTIDGMPGMSLEVPSADGADGPVINVYGRDVSVEILVTAAEAATVDGLEVSVPSAGLPAGWKLLDTDPDGVFMISPIAAVRGSMESRSAASYYVDGTQQRSLMVMSLARPATSLHTMRLFADSVETITVRGHEAIVGRFPSGGSSGDGTTVEWGESWVVRWMERPGEALWVGGFGVSRDEVLAAAESLEPVEPTRWSELVEATALGDLQPEGFDAEPQVEIGRGRFDDGTAWVLRGSDEDTDDLALSVALFGDSSGYGSTEVRATEPLIGPDGQPVETEPETFTLVSGLDQAGRSFSYGFVDPTATLVELQRPDGTRIDEAELVTSNGRKAWVVELTDDAATVVALTADGTELGRSPVGDGGAPDPLLPGAMQETTIPAPNPGPATTAGG